MFGKTFHTVLIFACLLNICFTADKDFGGAGAGSLTWKAYCSMRCMEYKSCLYMAYGVQTIAELNKAKALGTLFGKLCTEGNCDCSSDWS